MYARSQRLAALPDDDPALLRARIYAVERPLRAHAEPDNADDRRAAGARSRRCATAARSRCRPRSREERAPIRSCAPRDVAGIRRAAGGERQLRLIGAERPYRTQTDQEVIMRHIALILARRRRSRPARTAPAADRCAAPQAQAEYAQADRRQGRRARRSAACRTSIADDMRVIDDQTRRLPAASATSLCHALRTGGCNNLGERRLCAGDQAHRRGQPVPRRHCARWCDTVDRHDRRQLRGRQTSCPTRRPVSA